MSTTPDRKEELGKLEDAAQLAGDRVAAALRKLHEAMDKKKDREFKANGHDEEDRPA